MSRMPLFLTCSLAATLLSSGTLAFTDPLSPLSCLHQGSGQVFDVGPGMDYGAVGEVPWEALNAGDTVRIHWRETPYREKILLRRQGTADQPITVCGVPGPNNELPILDGDNATTRATMGYRVAATEARGLIHVSWGAGDLWGFKPRHIVIQGLHVRNAFHEYSFTAANGSSVPYNSNAAGVFVERGEHISLRALILSGNGNGFFVASGDSEEVLSRHIVLERSSLYGNGTVTVGADRHHNVYTEAEGVLFQFNYIGPLRSGSLGGALKDRSAGSVIRYNWIEGGARSIDLVEAQDSWSMVQDLPAYRRTMVYGNVLISGPGQSGPTYMVHYGGDSGVVDSYRKGTLYFYNNTVIVRSDQTGEDQRWRTVLFDVSTNDETVDSRNNLVFVRPATPNAEPTRLSWMRSAGVLELGVNWASPTLHEWRDGIEPTGSISGLENILTNPDNDPGLSDEMADDFTPLPAAQAVDQGMALHTEPASLGHFVDYEYVAQAAGRIRAILGAIDLGAFEAAQGLFHDRFEALLMQGVWEHSRP